MSHMPRPTRTKIASLGLQCTTFAIPWVRASTFIRCPRLTL